MSVFVLSSLCQSAHHTCSLTFAGQPLSHIAICDRKPHWKSKDVELTLKTTENVTRDSKTENYGKWLPDLFHICVSHFLTGSEPQKSEDRAAQNSQKDAARLKDGQYGCGSCGLQLAASSRAYFRLPSMCDWKSGQRCQKLKKKNRKGGCEDKSWPIWVWCLWSWFTIGVQFLSPLRAALSKASNFLCMRFLDHPQP